MTDLDSPTIGKITAALIDAQADFKPAVKDATNPHFQSKFVSLAGVIDAITEALRAHRIMVMQPTDRDPDGTTVLVTRLIHESGEFFGSRYPIKAVKPDPQAEGSALTYARRYALMAMVGIAPEDDDGNAASQAPARQARPAGPRPPKDPPFNPGPVAQSIEAASTANELIQIGTGIAGMAMPDDIRKELRAQYAERLAELQPARTP